MERRTLEQRFIQMFTHEVEYAYGLVMGGKPRNYSILAKKVSECYWRETFALVYEEDKAEVPYVGNFLYGSRLEFKPKFDYHGAMKEWKKRGKAPRGLQWTRSSDVEGIHAEVMEASGLFSETHCRNLDIINEKKKITIDLLLGHTSILAYCIGKREVENGYGKFKLDGNFEFSDEAERDMLLKRLMWQHAKKSLKEKGLL